MAIDPFNEDYIKNFDVVISSIDTFLLYRPNCFQLVDENNVKFTHSNDVINVFANNKKKFLNATNNVVKVENMKELESIKHRILSQPTFVKVLLQTNTGGSGSPRIKIFRKYIVFFNTKRPAIRNMLELNFEKCEKLMKEGKKFAFEIKLNHLLEGWFNRTMGFSDDLSAYNQSLGTKICITNCSRRSSIWRNVAWIVFFPCMLVIGPLICIYRKLAVEDFSYKVKGNVFKT